MEEEIEKKEGEKAGGDHSHGSDGVESDGGDHGQTVNFLSPGHLFEHIQDTDYFDLPTGTWSKKDPHHHNRLTIGQPYSDGETVLVEGSGSLTPMKLHLTKFMVLEVIILIVLIGVFGWFSRKIKGGKPAKGRFANLLEVFILFIRDEVARPNIGKSAGDKFLPFLLTIFFFILGCNLMGLLPFMGSPTAAWAVTSVLAVITFGVVCTVGIRKFGLVGFALAQVPRMDLPFGLNYIIKPMLLVIELFGLVLKHFVLSVRLLANMLAGHIMLAVFLAFVAESAGSYMQYLIIPAACGGYVVIMFLELFVAFLQAFIFTFLAALFIGSASHQH